MANSIVVRRSFGSTFEYLASFEYDEESDEELLVKFTPDKEYFSVAKISGEHFVTILKGLDDGNLIFPYFQPNHFPMAHLSDLEY